MANWRGQQPLEERPPSEPPPTPRPPLQANPPVFQDWALKPTKISKISRKLKLHTQPVLSKLKPANCSTSRVKAFADFSHS
eukprot:1558204-Pyramimonas_sp.AAC.1